MDVLGFFTPWICGFLAGLPWNRRNRPAAYVFKSKVVDVQPAGPNTTTLDVLPGSKYVCVGPLTKSVKAGDLMGFQCASPPLYFDQEETVPSEPPPFVTTNLMHLNGTIGVPPADWRLVGLGAEFDRAVDEAYSAANAGGRAQEPNP